MKEKEINVIVMPNLLNNPIYVKGLDQPLNAVANILDEQGQHVYALALRRASEICKAYAQVNLEKSAKLLLA